MGLSLNIKKCGVYSKDIKKIQEDLQEETETDEEDIPFLPVIREGYTYLGIHQLERDTPLNAAQVKEMALAKTAEIFNSKLAPSQKVSLFNSKVLTATVYTTGNLYPNESRASTLKRCSDNGKFQQEI